MHAPLDRIPPQVEIDAWRAELRTLKRKFDAVHQEGMAALKRGDVRAAGDALRREREIILQHSEILDLVSYALRALALRAVGTDRTL